MAMNEPFFERIDIKNPAPDFIPTHFIDVYCYFYNTGRGDNHTEEWRVSFPNEETATSYKTLLDKLKERKADGMWVDKQIGGDGFIEKVGKVRSFGELLNFQ